MARKFSRNNADLPSSATWLSTVLDSRF